MPNEEEFPMDSVTSSNILQIGYSNGAVRVVFVSRPEVTYEYSGVSQNDYDIIRNSPSLGSAVNKFLVRGPYSSRKL